MRRRPTKTTKKSRLVLRPKALLEAQALRAQRGERRKLVDSALVQARKDAARFGVELRKLRRKLKAMARQALNDATKERNAIQRVEQYETITAMRAAGYRWREAALAAGCYSTGNAASISQTMATKIGEVFSEK